MQDVFFISESYLKEISVINDNTDFKILKPTILMVQDIYLQKILGTVLYNDLKTKLIADTTLASSPNEKYLIDNYISKTLAWYVKMESILDFKFRFMNKGVMVKKGEYSESADTIDLRLIRDDAREKAEMYAEMMTKYLRFNIALFPKYAEYQVDGMTPIIKNYTNGIYLNDYGKDNQSKKGINGSQILFD